MDSNEGKNRSGPLGETSRPFGMDRQQDLRFRGAAVFDPLRNGASTEVPSGYERIAIFDVYESGAPPRYLDYDPKKWQVVELNNTSKDYDQKSKDLLSQGSLDAHALFKDKDVFLVRVGK